MRLKLLTLRFSPTLGGFDETPLQEFVRDRDILSFREHFFLVHDVPHLTCVLTWQQRAVESTDVAAAAPAAHPRSRRREATAPAESLPDRLDEAGRRTFAALREWRRTTSRAEGVPPYVLFTNAELVELVLANPESPTALGHVAGIGPGKVQRYGAAVLTMLAEHRARVVVEDPAGGREEKAQAPSAFEGAA